MNFWIKILLLISFTVCCSNAAFQCYEWTVDDRKEMGPKPSVSKEKAQCEKRHNVFTKGSNGNYKGCGSCWCCKRATFRSFGNVSNQVSLGSAIMSAMRCSLLKKLKRKCGSLSAV